MGAVEGYIDNTSNDDLSNVKVTLLETGVYKDHDYTDGNGYFKVEYPDFFFEPIYVVLKCEKHGYRTKYVGTTIEPFITTREDVTLNFKRALIVGISDYKVVSDLEYCDEDATDWYNFLDSKGYDCKVLGDGHTGNYPRHDAKATEANYNSYLEDLIDVAYSGDSIIFTTSGHGDYQGVVFYWINAWDSCSGESGEDGNLTNIELGAIFNGLRDGANAFVFIDHCYSGGMGPNLMYTDNGDQIYCTTTCTEDGHGYDDDGYDNGLWTYYFLDFSWQQEYGGNPGYSLETIFDYANGEEYQDEPQTEYPDDEPQEFDGNPSYSFYI
ncbi:MAG: caspase family protein [Candidatus Heimdallarchaeota archaeon]|nr:MAG: caspase family protein [Candidatus Heimdallarchaeota archaeon]